MADFSAPRAVLDTNLLVRLLISPRGVTSRLLSPLGQRAFQLVTSEPLLEELISTLLFSRHLVKHLSSISKEDRFAFAARLRRIALVVPGHYEDLDKVPSDLKDNIVVACALEAEADYIVTDDRRDLLPLKVIRCSGYHPVQIVSPLAFLRLVSH
ncbi:MAG TPA: putative toxin-antitoxin system toxin component, PIN family [Thermoanaerobaculia bacterium]|nr:putative toxin-antitoxin system toxin component, PIN family [Thermoanaerobaculia bacterium]